MTSTSLVSVSLINHNKQTQQQQTSQAQSRNKKKNYDNHPLERILIAYGEKLKTILQTDPKPFIYDIPFENGQENLELLEYVNLKPSKNSNDILFIQHYLTMFKSLIKMLFTRKSMTEPKELLSNIAYFLHFQELPKGSIICRLGDVGDRFYLVFKGKAAVFIPKEIKVVMTEKDYEAHINHLLELKEFDLATKTITSNKAIYDSDYIGEIKSKIYAKRQEEIQIIQTSKNLKNLEEKRVWDSVGLDEYIERTIPRESVIKQPKKNERIVYEEMYEVSVWSYYHIATIESGQTFGDVALSGAISLRTASILCSEDSLLGSLDFQVYKKCIKASQNIVRKQNIECILTNPIFENVSFEYFNKKYFNSFRLIEMVRSDTLFEQGETRKEVFFLKDGEIQLYTSSSLNEINNILDSFGFDNQNNKEEQKLIKSSVPLEKYFNTIQSNVKVVIYNSRNAIGLDDCMYKDIYFVTAKCQSHKASVYAVDYSIFEEMINQEKKIDRNVKEYFPLRREIMVVRLNKIKETFLMSRYNTFNDSKSKEEQTAENNKIMINRRLYHRMTIGHESAHVPQRKVYSNMTVNFFHHQEALRKQTTKKLTVIHDEAEEVNKECIRPKGRYFSSLLISQTGPNLIPINSNSPSPKESPVRKQERDNEHKLTHVSSIHVDNDTTEDNNCKTVTTEYIVNKNNEDDPCMMKKYIQKLDKFKEKKRLLMKNIIQSKGKVIKHFVSNNNSLSLATEILPEINNKIIFKAPVTTRHSHLVLKPIDILAYDKVIEKREAKKDDPILRGKKIKIRLPKIKYKMKYPLTLRTNTNY